MDTNLHLWTTKKSYYAQAVVLIQINYTGLYDNFISYKQVIHCSNGIY